MDLRVEAPLQMGLAYVWSSSEAPCGPMYPAGVRPLYGAKVLLGREDPCGLCPPNGEFSLYRGSTPTKSIGPHEVFFPSSSLGCSGDELDLTYDRQTQGYKCMSKGS